MTAMASGASGLATRSEGGGNRHGVPTENAGQVPSDMAGATGTAGDVVVAGVVVGVAGTVSRAGCGRSLRSADGGLRAWLRVALRGLMVGLGDAGGTGRGVVVGTRGRVLRGNEDVGVAGGAVGDALTRFGARLPGRRSAARLARVLGPGPGPTLRGQRMHLGLLGGHGHRLEQLGERIGGPRRGEGSCRNSGAAVVGTLRVGGVRRL